MKKILIPAFITLMSLNLFAQTSTQRIMIKGGNSAWENFMKEVFVFPAFEEGIVEYKNGQRLKGRMNYNKVIASIQFISEKGDTLALTNEETIANVSIGNTVFIYNPMCLATVSDDGNVKLYKHEVVRIADKQKTGGYGIPNTSGTITSVDHADSWLTSNQIDINESLLISKITTFYIETEKGEMLPAAKKNILSLYPKKEDEIKAFIKEKSLDLTKEGHLIQLAQFLAKL